MPSIRILLRFFFLILLSLSPSSYGFRNVGCRQDVFCPSQTFCYKPSSSVPVGTCIDCWSCCMFPDVFGECPESRCSCPKNNSCDAVRQCDTSRTGLFCSQATRTCRPCIECQDPECFLQGCVNYPMGECPNATYVFNAFYAYNIIRDTSSNQFFEITNADMETWLAKQQILNMFDRDYIYENLGISLSSPMDYRDVAGALEKMKITAHYCPDYANVTFPGCPCAPHPDTLTFRCPSGYACSRKQYHGISYMMFDDPVLHSLQAVCVPCRPGEFCSEGTVIDSEGTAGIFLKLRCPKGFYCPHAGEKYPCMNGTFCDEGFTEPLTCNYSRLLEKQLLLPRRQETVVERLVRYQDPYRGNVCPANSTSPETLCKSGYYCPDTSREIPCPEGFFCKPQSIRPRKCPSLSSCKEGSAEPEIVWIPYAFGICVVGSIVLMYMIKAMVQQGRCASKETTKADHVAEPTVHIELESLRTQMNHVPNDIVCSQFFESFIEKYALTSPSSSPTVESPITPLEELTLNQVSAPWLHSNSATFKSEKLNVIIGGSGCGKSTFLDLLRGHVSSGKISGYVTMKLKGDQSTIMDLDQLGGPRQWGTYQKMKNIRGYVPQDDVLYGDLTVRENLLFSALLKYSSNRAEVDRVVSFVIDKLGLTAIADKVVGSVERRGISGGQRKRVNIGMEVVTLPSLLIMDEPTSGLDANGCQSLIEFCKILNDINITIVAVIHQPRYTSFMLFDHIMLLSKYGTVFEGPPASALLYFTQGLEFKIDKNENPADALMDIISGNKGVSQQRLVDTWRMNGVNWLEELEKTYPINSHIMLYDVVFDEQTRTIVRAVFNAVCGTRKIIGWEEVRAVLEAFRLPVSEKQARSFVRSFGGVDTMMTTQFIKAIQERCAEGFLAHTYDNIIDRIPLFKRLPKSIHQKFSEATVTCHIIQAYRFGHILMRRLKKSALMKSQVPHIFNQSDKRTLDDEIYLLSMTAKAVNHYMHRKDQATEVMALCQSTRNTARRQIWQLNFGIVLWRKLLMIWRSPWPIQLIIPIVAAFIIGKIHGYSYDIQSFPNNTVSSMVCMGVLSMITHIRTFTLDKVVIKRETDAKIGVWSFLMAYAISDFLWITVIPIMFMVPYYYLTLPLTPFRELFGIAVLVCWWTSGVAYIISALPLAMHWANLIAVFVSVIYGAFLQGLDPTINESIKTFQSALIHMSYNRWAMEALTIKEFSHFEDTHANVVWNTMDKLGLCGLEGITMDAKQPSFKQVFDLKRKMQQDVLSTCSDYIEYSYLWLFGYGCMYRVLALFIFWYNSHPVWARFHWKVMSQIFHFIKK